MGKKRKAGGRPANKKDEERTKFDIEERFDGSEDEFQAGRDQILLEEAPGAKRRRKLAEEEEIFQPSDEEITGYRSLHDEDLEDDDDDDDDEEETDGNDYEDDDDMYQFQSKHKKKHGPNQMSPEEEDGEEGIAAWGSSKKDFYNADEIETEADALEEEEEAKRLQQKHLQAINEGDFGFDETEWVESGTAMDDTKENTGVVTEVLPQLEIADDMSIEEKLKILKSRYPEFEPLGKDFIDLQPEYHALTTALDATTSDEAENHTNFVPIAVVKYRALSAYLGAISMYFMLLASAHDSTTASTSLSPGQLRTHPVMDSLVKSRKLWETVKNLSVSETEIQEDEHVDEIQSSPGTPKREAKEAKESKAAQKERKRISKAMRAAQAAQAMAEARRAERLQETETNLANLSTLLTEPGRRRPIQKAPSLPLDADNSDLGDEDVLTAKEAEEKAQRKRSLRFYTSQIAQKSNKRNAAARIAGGDADIPYRERLKDRQARLNAEAEKRGRQQPKGAEQLGGDSDEEDRRVASELRGDGPGTDDDEYYDMVAARSKQRKDDKKARADAYATAAREGGRVEIQEEIGPDGKRAITYQIEKNKGLAPKRNKDNRNPRVKKRKRFEEKKKKLGSIRQLYKGGEGPGGYGGELTGIKKNLVKSVKL